MGTSDPFVRIELKDDLLPPSEPLAVDVHDNHGRLVVRAGEQVTRSLIDRLRKLGILEIFVTTAEAASPDFWPRWGEEWLRSARARMQLLTPEAGVPGEMLKRFDAALEKAVGETVRQRLSREES